MPILPPLPRPQRRRIHKIIHATRDKGHARRLMAILLLHEGRTITDVHHLTGAARSTIGRWLRWYRDEGVDALEALPAGRAPVLPIYRQDCHLTGAAHAVFSARFWLSAQPLVYRTIGHQNHAWLPVFITDYNKRFGKAPRHELDVHRALGPHDDLEHTLIWKEPRQVSKRLTTQYDKVQYLLLDTPAQRRLIGREIMVYHYCDDRVELRGPDGDLLDYCINDQLAPVNQGAIVDNKRLGHVLQMAQEVQTMRNDVRSRSLPNSPTTNRRRGPHPDKVKPNRLGEEQYYKALLDVSGERLEAQPDRPELADIAKEAVQTMEKRKRGRPPITGPRDESPSPVVMAAVAQWQQRISK